MDKKVYVVTEISGQDFDTEVVVNVYGTKESAQEAFNEKVDDTRDTLEENDAISEDSDTCFDVRDMEDDSHFIVIKLEEKEVQ